MVNVTYAAYNTQTTGVSPRKLLHRASLPLLTVDRAFLNASPSYAPRALPILSDAFISSKAPNLVRSSSSKCFARPRAAAGCHFYHRPNHYLDSILVSSLWKSRTRDSMNTYVACINSMLYASLKVYTRRYWFCCAYVRVLNSSRSSSMTRNDQRNFA